MPELNYTRKDLADLRYKEYQAFKALQRAFRTLDREAAKLAEDAYYELRRSLYATSVKKDFYKWDRNKVPASIDSLFAMCYAGMGAARVLVNELLTVGKKRRKFVPIGRSDQELKHLENISENVYSKSAMYSDIESLASAFTKEGQFKFVRDLINGFQ